MNDYQLMSRYLTTSIGRLERVKTLLENQDFKTIHDFETERNEGKIPDRRYVQSLIVWNQIQELRSIISDLYNLDKKVYHLEQENVK